MYCSYFPANCTDGTIRLAVGEPLGYEYYMAETDYDQLYYIDDKLSRGRVEICKGGGYHTICVDSWDERDASVVCRDLGFSPNGEKANCHVILSLDSRYFMKSDTISKVCAYCTFVYWGYI